MGGFKLDQVMSETKKDALEDPADDGAAIAGQESAGGAGRRNHPHSWFLCTLFRESQNETRKCLWVTRLSDEEVNFFLGQPASIQYIFFCVLNSSLRSLLMSPHLRSFYSHGIVCSPQIQVWLSS